MVNALQNNNDHVSLKIKMINCSLNSNYNALPNNDQCFTCDLRCGQAQKLEQLQKLPFCKAIKYAMVMCKIVKQAN